MPGRYVYDAARGRYRSVASGRFVPETTVRRALDRALAARQDAVRALSRQYAAGEITALEWQRAMRSAVKTVHTYSAAAAKGGFDRLTQADYGRIGAEVREQYGFLNDFGKEIKGGLDVAGDGFQARAGMYAESGRATFHRVERQQKLDYGFKYERSIRGKDDSCDECIAEEARGFQAIGEMTPVGARQCLSNCGCEVEYSDTLPDDEPDTPEDA